MTVLGNSFVVTVLSEGGGKPLTEAKFKAGEKADLIDLSRAAIVRTQPPGLPKNLPVPLENGKRRLPGAE